MPVPSFQYYIDSTGQLWSINVNPDGTLTTTVVSGSTTLPPTTFNNTTAGDIINSAIQDSQFRTTNQAALLDYVNRVSQRILRESQWQFLMSEPQKFLTQPGAIKYYIGPNTVTAPTGTVNTNLNLPDVWSIPNEYVFDASNWKQLMPDSHAPMVSPSYTYQDGTPRWDRPRSYLYEITNPNVINILPAPDNQNAYQSVPLPPICTVVAGGSLPNRIYYVNATLVDSLGNESTANSQATLIYVPAGFLVQVQQPIPEVSSASGVMYPYWNVYATQNTTTPPLTSSANLTKQNSTTLTTATWTEPTSGLTNTGPLPPQTSTLTPIYGYVIEFRYFRQRALIQGVNDILQIPDPYADVVIAGVNYYASMFLNNTAQPNDPARAIVWKQEFLDGIRQIRKDLNINFRRTDFIAPDAMTQYQYGNKLDYPSLGI